VWSKNTRRKIYLVTKVKGKIVTQVENVINSAKMLHN